MSPTVGGTTTTPIDGKEPPREKYVLHLETVTPAPREGGVMEPPTPPTVS